MLSVIFMIWLVSFFADIGSVLSGSLSKCSPTIVIIGLFCKLFRIEPKDPYKIRKVTMQSPLRLNDYHPCNKYGYINKKYVLDEIRICKDSKHFVVQFKDQPKNIYGPYDSEELKVMHNQIYGVAYLLDTQMYSFTGKAIGPFYYENRRKF